MTSTLAGPAASAATGTSQQPPAGGRALSALDLLSGGALLLVALLAWSSLALAHLGQHSAPAVLGVTLLAVVPLGGGAAVLARRAGVRLVADLPAVGVALACAAVAAALTFPGFSYGVADKDPGGYVSHAIAISQTGDYSFVDPVLATAALDPTFPVQLTSPGARFAGVWVRDASTGLIVPQFYHLWPALLATSYDLGGRSALLATVPLMGVLSVLALCAALRRAGTRLLGSTGGLVAAGAGGLLLATNMLQVWQARFPTTEVFAQALYVGALLGVVVALQTGWRPAAGLSGLLVGVAWLNRADGVLLVLLATAVGAALLSLRRWDARATWFLGGLAVVTPHALLQAYDLALAYSNANSIPSLPLLALAIGGSFALALVLRLLPLHRVADALHERRPQVVLGLLVVAGAVGLLALGFLRPRLFGADYFTYNDQGSIRSFDEQIMRRLSWFISLPGFALMVLGLTVVAVRRWHASVWALVLPTLPILAVYGFTASNSTRMLWWTRRYVPTVLPGVVVLVALALAFFVVWRYKGRLVTAVPAVAALAGLLAFFLSQSLPLRAHDEWKGSFALSQKLADLAQGEDGVYLWEVDQGCCASVTQLFATPLWLQHGQLSALLPSNASMELDGNARRTVIERYRERFAGQPLFVVADKGELPAGIDPASVQPVLDEELTLPMWEESNEERPDEAREVPVHVSVWRVR
ncbi:MAG: hypothetical protein JWM62_3167 [Frankiales bacterium]|nr:hypothetical protein [Frankiales bacterium]